MNAEAKTMSLQEIRGAQAPREANLPTVTVGFGTLQSFELIQRVGKVWASSSLVPKEYQGNLPNCIIALEMANRIGAGILQVMQNLYVVHGRPSWSAQFLIATFNTCGRFSAIRYEFTGKEGTDTWGCRANATELSTGEVLKGPLVTISISKQEGWYEKNGSKWKTMPEQMLRYRSASWFVRAYAPELAMGLHTSDEVRDGVVDIDAMDVMTLDDLRKGQPEKEEAVQAEEVHVQEPPIAPQSKAMPDFIT